MMIEKRLNLTVKIDDEEHCDSRCPFLILRGGGGAKCTLFSRIIEVERVLIEWKYVRFSGCVKAGAISPKSEMSYDGIEGFVHDLGATVRECIDCGCLIAGGPTRCKRCAREYD